MSKHAHHESHWISLSDMMTSLMMVFLLLAVLFMYQMQKVAADYQDIKDELHKELQEQFQEDFQKWNMSLDKNLTIKFGDPDGKGLFPFKSSTITPEFEAILKEFVPKYLKVVSQDKYKDVITEIRIEGHTAEWDDKEYLYTVELSQDRARSVLAFVRSQEAFNTLSPDVEKRMDFWMSANGLGKSRAVDDAGDLVFLSGKPISASSRRVEFKIITNSEDVITHFINKTSE